MRIQNYEIGEEFLRVGPSTFFRAQNVILGHPVVLRRLALDPERADDARQTFFREVRHAAALWHPRIWKPMDVLEAEGHLWSVHENRTWRTTDLVVKEQGPMTLARAARLGVQIADGLAHMHAKGFVHGKVTPRTVTVDEDGDALLINLVKSADLAAGVWPLRPVVLGLSAWSAPEEVGGSRATAETDLYGLAATLAFWLTGRPPHGGADEQEAFGRLQAGSPVDTAGLRRDLPPSLARALAFALESAPSARQGSVAALGSLLAEIERRHAADIPAGFEAGTLLPSPCDEGHVRIAERHGAGAFGIVFRATIGTECEVAVKALKPEHRDDREATERFMREARAMEGIEHPNVVRIYGVGEQRGTPYAVMEFVPGQDLATLLLREGVLPPARAARLLAGVARGLAAIHADGIVHRDLKPHNVLVGRDEGGAERPVIADFGVARSVRHDRLTMTGQLVGSPAYMAPEQVTDQTITHATDLYALGVMLYELLTGRTPFAGQDALATLRRIRDEAHPPLPADVPPELGRLVDRLLAKIPSQRPSDAGEVALALERFEGGCSESSAPCAPGDLACPANPV